LLSAYGSFRDPTTLTDGATLDDFSDDLRHSAANLEKAEIGMEIYTRYVREEHFQIDIFEYRVFAEYRHLLFSILSDISDQSTITPEQMQMVRAIKHDIEHIQETFVVALATKQPLPEMVTRMQAITPTLQVNPVRQQLGLFPSRFPQEISTRDAREFWVELEASTTCVEVGQPVTFTLRVSNYSSTQAPVSLDGLAIWITSDQPTVRWSPSDADPSALEAPLPYPETRLYEWSWVPTSAFSGTTVTVQTAEQAPELLPNSDLDSDYSVNEGLRVGIGTLTQHRKDQPVSIDPRFTILSPRSLPCAAMVSP
jgi:hypothetical protein